jgi:hypothetical protein
MSTKANTSCTLMFGILLMASGVIICMLGVNVHIKNAWMNNILGLECSGTLVLIPYYIQIGIYVIGGLMTLSGLCVIPTVLKRTCICTCGYGCLLMLLLIVMLPLSIGMAAIFLVRPSHI